MSHNIEKIKKYLKNIDSKEIDGKIHVRISVMPYGDHRCGEKVRVNLTDVLVLLSEKKIKHGKCIRNPEIQNKRKNSEVWIFEKQKTVPSRSRNSVRKNNSRKSKKNLDNLQKSVIIKETQTEE